MESKDLQSFKNAFLITFLYFIFGITWIIITDNIVATSVNATDELTLMQTYKGWFFIFITAVFLFALSYRFFSKIHQQYLKQSQEREKHQKEISKNDMLVRTIVNSSPDAIFVKDLDGKYALFNNGAANIVGIDADKIIGKDDFALFPQEDAQRLRSHDKEIIEAGIIKTTEEQVTTMFGVKSFLVTKGPLFTESGEVFGLFGISRDITEQKQYEEFLQKSKEEFYHLAHIDILTGLPNRLYFTEVMRDKCDTKKPFSMILLDLDEFKIVNDSYGHRFGDRLLVEVSKIFVDIFGDSSFVARMGGDEFAIIMDSNDQDYIVSLMKNLHDTLNNSFHIGDIEVYITASSGISIYGNNATMEVMLQEADAAMSNAKKTGKNKFSFFDIQYTQDALNHTKIATNLKKALKSNELELYFQPQYNPYNNEIVGFEALIRWNFEDTMILPSQFIPIAEETGLIVEIGDFVLMESLKTAVRWHKDGIFKGKIAINVSARQFIHLEFVNTIEKFLKETGCEPSFIELEITESSILENPEYTISILKSLKEMGFHISLDDFGTGYSSLSYLKNLPIDKIKIDQSFIKNITYQEKNQTIVKTIISLAKGLNMKVIAEGVESEQELDFLQKYGIDYIQGFYYSKPLPLSNVEELLSLK